jgi:hypothetical protein
MRAVLVYEDHEPSALHAVVRKTLNARFDASGRSGPWPELTHLSSKGVGNMSHVVGRQWPIYRRTGFPRGGHKPDALICIADADRLHEHIPGVAAPPPVPADTEAWRAEAERSLTAFLRGQAVVDAERIHGHLLRWNAESLLIAAYDHLDIASGLQPIDEGKLEEFLEACREQPLESQDYAFMSRHRRPTRCFDDLCSAVGLPRVPKTAKLRGDILRIAARRDLETLCARVPDLPRLADRILDLTASDD